MKKINVLLSLFFTGFLILSCGKEEISGIDPNAPVEVQFSSGIQVLTKAVDDKWSQNDEIGIFMLKSGESLASGNIAEGADNRSYKIADQTDASVGKFSPTDAAQTIYYPVNGDAVDFMAYYPHISPLTDYIYPIDTKTLNQANQEKIDLMYSNKISGKSKTDKSVNFTFNHLLSKVEFNITPGIGLSASDLSGLTITMKDFYTQSNCDLKTGNLSTPTNPLDIEAKMKSDGSYAEAILIPQSAENKIFVFKIGNDEFQWKNTDLISKTFMKGQKYNCRVTINRTYVEITGSIKNWSQVGPINIIAD